MYIKRITIQGFKTYKNTTVIDLVSQHHNVVVGRNGSGKSNFFAAIRFVLSDAYTHMTREERQGLIHEGSGTVMSAYVEIVFDNSDGRFPLSKEEISIRRTIGLKKDDYSLDGRSATRSDIMNLLESAGFSRSNPYYIVPQGRITSLTNSKDAERLTLLKEVSGATVFENKLKESVKEMNNSNYKKQRIDETLASIDERLSDLQIESADLKEFQALEKKKKVLEYNLFDREFNDLQELKEDIEEKYAQLMQESQDDLSELNKREKLCQQLLDTINSLKVSLKVSKLEKEQTDLDYNQILKRITDKEIVLHELKSNLHSSQEKYGQLQTLIDQYKSLIQKHESYISKFKPDFNSLHEKEAQLKANLTILVAKQRALYSKQNRFQKFSSKNQRDSWLNKEIADVKKKIQSKDYEITQINLDIRGHETTLSDINEQISELDSEINNESHRLSIAKLKTSIGNMKSKLNDINDQRKSLWRDEIRLKGVYDSINNDLTNATNLVNQTMDRSQAQGLTAVKAIAAKLNLTENVYGPLADLFVVNEKYKTATEVIAGNSLFHIVVDSDSTASLIMDELVRTKSGRATFMPLNRLEIQQVEYPDSNEHQCIPLVKKLKFDDAKVGKAIRQVFGKTIVCHDLQSGSELARAYKLSAITLDGDRADTRGVMTGGFRDYKKSRIDALKNQTKKKKDLQKVETDLKKCTDEITTVNQKITALNSELQLSVRDLDKLESSQEPNKIKLSQLTNKKFNLEQELSTLQYNVEIVRTAKTSLNSNLKQHESELNSSFTQSLTDEELQNLRDLNEEVGKLEANLDETVTQMSEIEAKLVSYESELNSNYKPHLQKLVNEQNYLRSGTAQSLDIKDLEAELASLHINLDTAESRNQKASYEFSRIEDEINKSESALQKANDQQITILKKLEKFSKVSEKTLNKKSILSNRSDELQKKIRDLGALPEEAFQQSNYNQYDSDQLLKQLNKVNDKLAKYSHINKKAMEQFSTFTKQRDELVGRREELEKSHESIETLIKKLKLQKNEAIRKSFKQVAKSFHDIFENLVPLGVGNLIMHKKIEDKEKEALMEEDDDMAVSDSDSDANDDDIENYVGVSISVSFNSKHDEQQRIEQLSGGQKSLCAIALILAIQKCDPAPFYLFDEIDANLDTQYRTAVAAMINSLSTKAQFICTTFRPEMLRVADKFYGVMFNNKVSTVTEINREEAMTFVEGQVHH
ncbi:RecF/RecN/SMC protein [Suhomyces tanzawaensis NRRL Y-17324]|uniref:Structural maintenance of chromosomes protein n=1 Tax=Suhomyces tanzawaensis NRRL Y-17324 TaxID=984487 RepID=A0A1E4SG07_9ASCO|nr:RecF/RecN/SMC protein [Suhomyces tanzawaensis NRRL Y-17324]ODV78448.1 RecF/RecN/SMC protein [Suhomyces tanzawaensis NRRL Y-17324]